MCGIIGSFALGRDPAPALNSLRLRHRGPDAHGEWHAENGRCSLWHTRLSILDQSEAGRQPMADSSGNYIVVFNGEIYNHGQLRARIQNHAWRGGSDTETLLELWRMEGAAAIPLLKGMFAFAIYDRREETLWAIRDRFGIKPFYYRKWSGAFCFASEERALIDRDSPELSDRALAEYLRYGRIRLNGGFSQEIAELPPGHWLRLDRDGALETGSYWPPRKIDPLRCSRIEARRLVRERLEIAVREHLLSDVPVASFLSGGIDSSVLTALAAKHLGEQLQCFSIGFSEREFDETPVAALVARRAKCRHHVIEVTHDEVLRQVEEAVSKMDVPSVDAVNTYIVSNAVASRGIKVALSGLGGDELFGGYPSFGHASKLRLLGMLPRALSRTLVRFAPGAVRSKLSDLRSFDVGAIAEARRAFFGSGDIREAGLSDAQLPCANGPHTPDYFSDISWAELTGYTAPMLLRDSDQMAMAASLEIRVPFLDHELVEAVLGLRAENKRGRGVKPLLVEACADLIPSEVYDRPKQGFVLPMTAWMRGPLATFCGDGLRMAEHRIESQFIRRVESGFNSGKLHWTRLWMLVVLGHVLGRSSKLN